MLITNNKLHGQSTKGQKGASFLVIAPSHPCSKSQLWRLETNLALFWHRAVRPPSPKLTVFFSLFLLKVPLLTVTVHGRFHQLQPNGNIGPADHTVTLPCVWPDP